MGGKKLTLHLETEYFCENCGSFYIPYEENIDCPKCSVKSNIVLKGFYNDIYRSCLINIKQYKSFVPPSFAIMHQSDSIQYLIFNILNYCIKHNLTNYLKNDYNIEINIDRIKKEFNICTKNFKKKFDWEKVKYVENYWFDYIKILSIKILADLFKKNKKLLMETFTLEEKESLENLSIREFELNSTSALERRFHTKSGNRDEFFNRFNQLSYLPDFYIYFDWLWKQFGFETVPKIRKQTKINSFLGFLFGKFINIDIKYSFKNENLFKKEKFLVREFRIICYSIVILNLSNKKLIQERLGREILIQYTYDPYKKYPIDYFDKPENIMEYYTEGISEYKKYNRNNWDKCFMNRAAQTLSKESLANEDKLLFDKHKWEKGSKKIFYHKMNPLLELEKLVQKISTQKNKSIEQKIDMLYKK